MKTLNKIFWRSLLLQAVWSYERMQNLGCLYTILPKLKELHASDIDALKESSRRYMGYFNTHPYMSPIIFGVTARLEEEIAKSEDPESVVDELKRFKLQMAGPLAAMGDKFFWSIWRPITGLIGIVLVILGLRPLILVPIAFLLIYNLPVFIHKRKFLLAAYRDKTSVIDKIGKLNQSKLVSKLPMLGLFITGIAIAMAIVNIGIVKGGIFAGTVLVVVVVREYFRFSATKLIYVIALLTVLVNYLLL